MTWASGKAAKVDYNEVRRDAGQLLVSVPVCGFEFASGAAAFAGVWGSADKSFVEEIDGGVCFAAHVELEPCAFEGAQLLGRAGYLQLGNERSLPLSVLLED